MIGATPDYVLQQAVHNQQGIIVDTKDYHKYVLDLNGWFMWWGEMYLMSGKSLGAGLTRITAKPKYPKREVSK